MVAKIYTSNIRKKLTNRVTVARETDVTPSLEEVLLAPFTVSPVPVLRTVDTMAAVSSPFVQLLVEVTLI